MALVGLARLLAFEDPLVAERLARDAVAAGSVHSRQAQALSAAGWVALTAGDMGSALARANEAATEARRRSDAIALAEAVELEGVATRSAPRLRKALELWREQGAAVGQARVEFALVRISPRRGRRSRRRSRACGNWASTWRLRPAPRERTPRFRAGRAPRSRLSRWAPSGSFARTARFRTRPGSRSKLGTCSRFSPRIGVNRFRATCSWRRCGQSRIRRPSRTDWPCCSPRYAPCSIRRRRTTRTTSSFRGAAPLPSISLTSKSTSTASCIWSRQAWTPGIPSFSCGPSSSTPAISCPRTRTRTGRRRCGTKARSTYVAAARALARHATDADSAARFLQRLLAVEPYDEEAHLALVETLVTAGRHGEARRRYLRYTALMNEIDVEPAPFPGR